MVMVVVTAMALFFWDVMLISVMFIRASFAKDIGALSMVPSENELVLSPNSLHNVVASFGSDQLEDLQGKHFFRGFFHMRS